jgi:sulfur carrier protein ThiS
MTAFLEKINEASSAVTYRIIERITVGSILAELKLEDKFFVILVNGRKSELAFNVEPGDEILILPKMAVR